MSLRNWLISTMKRLQRSRDLFARSRRHQAQRDAQLVSLEGCESLEDRALLTGGALIEQESFEAGTGGDFGFTLTGSGTPAGRITNASLTGPPAGADGSFVVGSALTTTAIVVTMDAVTITGLTNTSVGVRLAAPGGSVYDSLDYLVVEVSIDSGAYSPLAVFESTLRPDSTDNFNEPFSLVEPTPIARPDGGAESDGAGNTVLTTDFQDFEWDIPTGTTVEVRVRWRGNSSNEEIAVDDIRVFGDVAATNPPVLGGVPGTVLTYTEGDGAVAIAPALTATDSDSNITGATVAITGNYDAGEDTLVYTPTNGVTIVSNVGGVLTLTGDRPASDYQAALRTVQYENTNTTNPSLSDRVITFTASDGANNSNQPTRTVDVIDTFLTNSLPYQEDFETDGSGSRYEVVGGFDNSPAEAYFTRITDADTRFPVMTDESGTSYFAGEQIDPGNGLGGAASSVIAQLDAAGFSNLELDILLGAPNNDQYDSADFIAVSYQFDNSGPFIELIDFHSTGFNGELREDTTGDGVGDGTPLTSTFQNFNVSIPDTGSLLKVRVDVYSNGGTEEIAFDNIRVNGVVLGSPPVLSGTDAGPIAYTEGDGAVQVTSAATITDSDSTVMSSATVQITTNYVVGEDVLSVAGALPGGITSAFDAPSGTLTLSGTPTASIADFQTALTQVRYENTNLTAPSEATRTVAFRVTDDTTAGSNATSLDIQVTDVVMTHPLPFQESFETDGRGTRYRVDGFFDQAPSEFFTDIALNRTSAPLTNADGTRAFGGDHTGNGGGSLHAVTFNLDTSGSSGFELNVLLAAPSGSTYDSADFILIERNSDGGGFQRIASFESTGGGFNTTLSEDTNNDGDGDGTVLTAAFQNFTYTLPDAASTIIRITVPSTSTAVDEEYAFDNVRVAVPDVIPPTFEAPRSNPTDKHTNVNDVTWLIQFSEPVSGVDASDFDLNFVAAGGVSLTDAGDADDSTYLLTATTVPEGTLQIDQINPVSGITDGGGNAVVQARQGLNGDHRFKVDRTAPTPVISSTEGSPTNAPVIPITVDFGEAVFGFEQTDVSLTNGTISDFVLDNNLQTSSFNITPLGNGVITVDIAAAAAADPAGNDSNAATQFTIDSQILTAAITRVNPTPTTATSVDFNVIFTDPVINVDPSDFVVATTGSASADALVSVGDAGDVDDSTYVVTVTSVSRHGTLGLDFAPATDIQTAGGTPVTQTPTTDEVYDVINDAHGILSLPARTPGDVTAVVSGIHLILTPDAGDNGISISTDAGGDIVVTGLGGTTINGVADFVAFSAVGGVLPGNLTVNGSAGRDLISIADLTVSGRALLYGGDDVDAIDIIDTNVNGNLTAFENGGDGFIDIAGSTITGVAQILAGEGHNTVTVTNTLFQNVLAITGGSGIDQFTLNTVTVSGSTQISPGGGNDILSLTDTIHQSTLYISADAGNDTVTGNNVDVTLTAHLNLGAGDDIADFDDLHAFSTAVLIAGADNDSVRFLNSRFDALANMPITAGNNVVDVQGSTFHGATYVQATAGALAVRIRNNTFTSTVSLTGGPGNTDVLMDNGTSSFAFPANVTGFEDLTNTHIDAAFADLLGLVFP